MILGDSTSVDYAASAYLQFLYDEECPMCWAADTLSALQDMMPSLKRQLPESWRCFGAWQRLEPPERARPLHISILQFMVATLLRMIVEDNCFVILTVVLHMCLVFHLFRPAEIRGLEWSDFRFSQVFRENKWFTVLTIAVDHSKTSVRKRIVEYVLIEDSFTIFIAQILFNHHLSSEVWPFSSSYFHSIFLALQKELKIVGYVPYSLKRGGATAHFLRYQSFDLLVHAGRWRNAASARVYIEDALAAQSRLRTPAAANDPQHRAYLRRALRKSGVVGSSLILEL